MQRCSWCNLKNPIYVKYHDEEWGQLNLNDDYLLEMLILEICEAGLSFECVLNKREHIRLAFANYSLSSLIKYDEEKEQELLQNKNIIRNKLKIKAIINNAKIFNNIKEEFASFHNYLKTFTNDEVIIETNKTTNKLAQALAKDLKRRGMKFIGDKIIYAYLQAIGIIYSHEKECFLYKDEHE